VNVLVDVAGYLTFETWSNIGGTAVDGLVLGGAYLLSGRNLWVAILAHGFSDTFAVAAVYFGLAG